MAELSKTARQSMGKQTKEVHTETPEEAIRQLRLNRAAGLHIGDMSRVDALLKAYDQALFELQEYLKLGKMAEDLNKISQAWNGQDVVVKAEIPAQEEDPNHMNDFEHGGK
jgi:hypothetical protein